LGFGLAGLGMLAGVIQYVLQLKFLGDAGRQPASTGDAAADAKQRRNAIWSVGAGLAVFALLGILGATGAVTFTASMISDSLGWGLLGISVVVFAWLIFSHAWTLEERKRSAAILVLFIASAVFWASYEQAGSSLSLFAERSTDRHIFGYEFPASWFQFIQPVFVIALAPVFAWLWLALNRRNLEPSSPAKFSLGLLWGGLGIAILVPAALMAAHGTMVSYWWLTGTYFMQTIGELCLSPVGLSAMTKLAPARAAGFMMGIWFLSISIGNWTAGKAASLYSSIPLPSLFAIIAGLTMVATLALVLLVRPTVRLMSGVK
jgi:POT family proton-dependent oligopeptide transporter